jgi:hypothetical protein
MLALRTHEPEIGRLQTGVGIPSDPMLANGSGRCLLLGPTLTDTMQCKACQSMIEVSATRLAIQCPLPRLLEGHRKAYKRGLSTPPVPAASLRD